MKPFVLALLFLAIACTACVKNDIPIDEGKRTQANRLQTTEEFEVPVQEGHVTQVSMNGTMLAEVVTPVTILIPKQSGTRSGGGLSLTYVPMSEYPNSIDMKNNTKLFQVVCFEDSRQSDYDYNDFVFHVKYQTRGNKFGFIIQPIALGSTKPIKLGCVVYKGNTRLFKGIITQLNGATGEYNDCRTQYFQGQEGMINTFGNQINQQSNLHTYMASSRRVWETNKVNDKGAPRVEWYIVVDGGTELYALSTNYLDQSFDKEGRPYGFVITDTGSTYTDEYGYVCGKDWFNYPQESTHINDVYPEIWKWLAGNGSYNFSDIYNSSNVPAKAYPASDLRLYEVTDTDVIK